MIVDSHCHLDRLELPVEDALAAARARGVTRFLTVSVVLSEFPNIYQYAERYEDVDCSCGVHPDEDQQRVSAEELMLYAKRPKVLALGETGLDFYREFNQDIQTHNFITHIEVAKALQKPLIIHTRAASEDTLLLMKQHGAETVRGVMHCFTESWAVAEAAMALGFYISISGIVTFKNAHQVQEVAKRVPLDRLLIETDSPYLAPVPYRGKSNQPAYVRDVAECVAALREISIETLAKQTTQNYWDLFHRGHQHV